MTFAEQLIAYRLAPRPGLPRGLSQTELGRRAGLIPQTVISDIERGVSRPSDANFLAIAHALGLSKAEREAWWLLRLESTAAAVSGR